MAFVSKKIIGGRKQFYLEKSIRLPDGKVKKISVYIKDYDPERSDISKYRKLLDEKVRRTFISFALDNYKRSTVLDEKTIEKLECIRLDYGKIVKLLTKNQFKDLLDRFAINFTYETNAIEGNSLTLKDVTFVIHENRLPSGKDLREVYETLNTRKAIGFIFRTQPKITSDLIIKLHTMMIAKTGAARGFKKVPNFLLGRNVQTTPPENVEKEIKKIIDWCDAARDIHPLQVVSEFHGMFEKIHPFEDGNGRVGRLLVNLMLLKKGYPPLIIRKSQRIAYFHSLEAFDNGYEDRLLRFMIDKYKATYRKFFEVYVKYV